MLCALPAAARRPVYAANRKFLDCAGALDRAWRARGMRGFNCDTLGYAIALEQATRAHVRRAVAELLEKDAN